MVIFTDVNVSGLKRNLIFVGRKVDANDGRLRERFDVVVVFCSAENNAEVQINEVPKAFNIKTRSIS